MNHLKYILTIILMSITMSSCHSQKDIIHFDGIEMIFSFENFQSFLSDSTFAYLDEDAIDLDNLAFLEGKESYPTPYITVTIEPIALNAFHKAYEQKSSEDEFSIFEYWNETKRCYQFILSYASLEEED